MKNYQHLNLEQKMTKIRKNIPVLIKKYHSEDVNYDFSKLDDIYELMTPALNKYNVNFEPVEERPTQVNESGNPTYLTMDKDGYWRYEADLDLCWTNADRPEDQKIVTIHAIGTHEIPDKAKGAAWTYSMKYYLRNKFSVPQGSDEDPDMRVHGLPEKEQAPPKEAGVKNSSSGQKYPAGRPGQEPAKQKPVTQESAMQEPAKQGAAKQAPAKENVSVEKQDRVKAEKKKQEPEMKVEEEKKADVTLEEKPDTGTAEQKEATERAEEKPAAVSDGFEAVSEEDEIPFDEFEEDEGLMEALNEEITGEDEEVDSEFQAARQVKCTFGIFNGKTLGTILDSGTKGIETLRWLVNSYKGADRKMVDAARILLEGGRNNSEKLAA